MLDIAELLLFECKMLNLYSIVASIEDARYGIGLPLIVYNRVNAASYAEIDAAFIWHTNYTNTALKISLHRSLISWSDDTKIILYTEKLPHLSFLQYMRNTNLQYIIMVTERGKVFHYNPFRNEIIENCNLNTIIRDFHGSPLKMSAYRDPLAFLGIGSGIDGTFIAELGKYLNFTINIIKSTNFNNAVDQLMQGMSDMIVNAYFTCSFHENLKTITFPLYQDKECVAIREAEILRGWYVFAHTIGWKAFFAIIGAALFTNGITVLLSKHYDWSTMWPLTLRAMFMIPMTKPLVGTRERCIIGGCLLFGSVLVTTYQATLYHFIKTEVRHKIPESLDELRQENISPKQLEFITDERTFIDKQLVDSDKDAFLIRYKLYGLMKYTGMIVNFRLIPESICEGNMGYAMKQDSILLETINRYIQWLAQAGLPKAWHGKTIHNQEKIADSNTIGKQSLGDIVALQIQDLEVAFFVVIVGHISGILWFTVELMASVVSKRLIRKKPKFRQRLVFVN